MGALTNIDWTVTDVPFQKGQAAYIEFGKGCALLNSQGVTQEAIGQRYEMSQGQVMKACRTGLDLRLINRNTITLPRSQESLYLLTTLDDEDFEYVIEEFGPKATQADLKAVKAGFNSVEEQKYSEDWDKAYSTNRLKDKLRLIKDWDEAIVEDGERFPEPEPEPEPLPVFTPNESPEQLLINEFAILLNSRSPIAGKAIKNMFSTLYHSDAGKLSKDDTRMGAINAALTKLYKEKS